jgi:hypothetical protein
MDDKVATVYPHRQNRDLSYDSICPICFATVSSQKIEAELAEYERHHVCDIFDLYQRGVRPPLGSN